MNNWCKGTNLRMMRNVFVVSFLVLAYLFIPTSITQAATLSLSPSTGVYKAGQTFTAQVLLNTEGVAVNAADGTLSFNASELSVISISKGSIFNLWTAEPAFSNSAGSISFSGGNPTGYKGGGGSVISISFRAKSSGTSRVSFIKGSALAADGRGTNVLSNMSGGTYTLVAQDVTPEPEIIEYIAPANTPGAPNVTSATHPDPNNFYSKKEAVLKWVIPSGVTGVRTLLDGNSGSIPTRVYDNPISEITLNDLEEGVQYFHIQFRNAEGWGRVSHYRLGVDSEKPTEFNISLPENADLSNPVQTLLFEVKDETSKVKRFLVQLNNNEAYEYIDETGSSSMILPKLDPGYHSIIIEAFDEAGNSIIDTFSFSILAFDKPQFTEYPNEINEEVIPVIKGITRPNSIVEVMMQKVGSDLQTYQVKSNEGGEFVFIPDSRLSLGVYELSAVAIDEFGAKSEVSDKIKVAVQQPGYLRIGSFLVSLLSVIIPLIALLVLFGLFIWFLFLRLKKLRGGVKKESAEAISILNKEFSTLSQLLRDQENSLQKSRKSGKLTIAETNLVKTLSEAMDSAKKRVVKEVQDVEDIVD